MSATLRRSTEIAFAEIAFAALAAVAGVALALGVSGCGHSSSSSSSSGTTTTSSTSSGMTFSPAASTVIQATAGPLPPGTTPFSQTFSVVSGGTPPYTFQATSLPPGLALAGASVQPGLVGTLSAILSGTPSQPGLETFAMTVTDANLHTFFGSWTIEVQPAIPALTVTPSTLPNGTRGQAYQVYLDATNAVLPVTWTVSTGPLPPGIVTTPSTSQMFELSGTPTTAGTFNFTVTVNDSSNPGPKKAVLNLSLTVP